jgi:hypothetical protein
MLPRVKNSHHKVLLGLCGKDGGEDWDMIEYDSINIEQEIPNLWLAQSLRI